MEPCQRSHILSHTPNAPAGNGAHTGEGGGGVGYSALRSFNYIPMACADTCVADTHGDIPDVLPHSFNYITPVVGSMSTEDPFRCVCVGGGGGGQAQGVMLRCHRKRVSYTAHA